MEFEKIEIKINRSAAIILGSVLILAAAILISSPSAEAIDIGGKASFINYLTYSDSEFENDFASEVELELFLPSDSAVSLENRAVITIDESSEEEKVDLWFKKLYLRQKIGEITAKFGRQPISWSYGALINPVDYSLGAENLDQEGRAKFVDAVELYYPVNWGTGVTFITSDLEGESDNKWALRGRTTLRGYDLSASYVKTPSSTKNGDLDRFGMTAKGDLGPVGLYGAFGLWENNTIDYDIYQIGADYSYNFFSGSQLYLQGEYLAIKGVEREFSGFDFLDVDQEENNSENDTNDSFNESSKLEFINTNLSYDIDDFSAVGLMTVTYLGDGSTLFIPNYSYLFSSNLLLEVRGSLAAGSEDEVLGGDAKALELSLSYTF
jgi:hypothetical protein